MSLQPAQRRLRSWRRRQRPMARPRSTSPSTSPRRLNKPITPSGPRPSGAALFLPPLPPANISQLQFTRWHTATPVLFPVIWQQPYPVHGHSVVPPPSLSTLDFAQYKKCPNFTLTSTV